MHALWTYRWHIAYLLIVPIAVVIAAISFRLFELQDVVEYDVRCQSVRVPAGLRRLAVDAGIPVDDRAAYMLRLIACLNEKGDIIGYKSVLYADVIVRDGRGRLNRLDLAITETPCHTEPTGLHGALVDAAGWFALCAEEDGKTLMFPTVLEAYEE